MQGTYGTNFRAPKVNAHDFAMIPRADIPRSKFRMQTNHKTTMRASSLIPIYLQEVLPGDSFALNETAFVRLTTPIVPFMDNIDIETWYFFVPNRLVWTHWVNFMGEQVNPSDSISFSIPQVVSPVNGFQAFSIYDYFGLPTAGQTAVGNTISVSSLPFRAYNIIWNQWFRDENLQNSAPIDTGDGPDANTDFAIKAVNKRHDYFTSCLPWTQKGGVAITVPLGTSAIVKTSGTEAFTGSQLATLWRGSTGAQIAPNHAIAGLLQQAATSNIIETGTTTLTSPTGVGIYPTNLYADLSTATAATINQLRLAFQTQKLLERDARAGTRYTEIIRSHFGVISPDMRLQRPEYLGGNKTPINITPVPQTMATGATGTTTPLGTLSAAGTAIHRGGFRQSFTEHGHIIGLAAVRQTPVYQQGIRRLWKRSTRYDFYFPVFQALGEQAVLNSELYSDGSANDALTFGFQERWAEYRYHPSIVTGTFRSTYATPIDYWHLAEKFIALPALNGTFVQDNTQSPVNRGSVIQLPDQQFLCDFFFDVKAARPMPMYSVPGLIDHF